MATVFKRKKRADNKKAKWTVRWKDAESRQWRASTGYTDKQASLALGERLEQEAAHRVEGLTNPTDEHRRRPVLEHLDDFMTGLGTGERNDRYVLQVKSRILRIIEGTEVQLLQDMDPVRIVKFLSSLRVKGRSLSGVTRNEYIVSIKCFTSWAVRSRRMDYDPLATLKRIGRKAIKPKHPRRALTMAEIGRLLEAATRRPLLEVQTVRTGKNKGKPVAKVSKEVRDKMIRLGQERRVAYLLAYWTGLRRSEIAKLQWQDIDLDVAPPRIRLRAETTKSNRADVQVIHPQLAEMLREWSLKRAGKNRSVVSSVPCMKVMKADLQLAGIEYGNEQIGYADLHAQRMSLSTSMAVHRLSPRVRQAHMRHTDPRLTDVTYMDESLLPVADELYSMPWIPDPNDQEPEAIPLRKTGTDQIDDMPSRTPNMHQTSGVRGQNGARGDKSSVLAAASGSMREQGRDASQGASVTRVGKKRQEPASCDTGSDPKRAMRFELTTFTLATCRPRVAKGVYNNDLAFRGIFDAPNMHQTPGTEEPDPDLAALVSAWQKLPIAIKTGISAMVRTIVPTS